MWISALHFLVAFCLNCFRYFNMMSAHCYLLLHIAICFCTLLFVATWSPWFTHPTLYYMFLKVISP